jgi:hypothetical protein
MSGFFGPGITSLLLTAGCTLEVAFRMRRMTTLDNILLLKQKHLPKVFVIIPARNR